jgi:hypothetical protein
MAMVSVTLSSGALRRALDLLESDNLGSLDDLVEQLIITASNKSSGDNAIPVQPTASSLLSRDDLLAPIGDPGQLRVTGTPSAAKGRLPFLTSRLNPLKVVCRALANAALVESSWPYPNAFLHQAGGAARELGMILRADDATAGRKGLARRWIGYPVGKQSEAAIARFGFAFGAAWSPSGQLGGPLVVLGLVAPIDETIALTEAGWRLAAMPSPLLGEIDAAGARLSPDEVGLLTARLLDAPQEAELITDFVASVREGVGRQSAIDRALAVRRPEWSAEQATSERAALVGQLHELGAVRVIGRGRDARIELLGLEGLEISKEQP